MKRYITLFLLLLMIISFAACNEEAASKEEQEPQKEQEEEIKEEEAVVYIDLPEVDEEPQYVTSETKSYWNKITNEKYLVVNHTDDIAVYLNLKGSQSEPPVVLLDEVEIIDGVVHVPANSGTIKYPIIVTKNDPSILIEGWNREGEYKNKFMFAGPWFDAVTVIRRDTSDPGVGVQINLSNGTAQTVTIIWDGVEEDSDKYLSSEDIKDADEILSFVSIPKELGAPKLTSEEVKQMVDDNLDIDLLASKLTTIADCLQYLHQKGMVYGGGDNTVLKDDMYWSSNYSADIVLKNGYGSCGGLANLLNYLLDGDYDDEGYIHSINNTEGHVFNRVSIGATDYYIDLTKIIGSDGSWSRYKVNSANHGEYANIYGLDENGFSEPGKNNYMLLVWEYSANGEPHMSLGCKDGKTETGHYLFNIFPKSYEERITSMYYPDAKWAPKYIER